MHKIYSHFRIFLMMFAFGLASVNFFNGFDIQEDKIHVNLPQVESNTLIYVYPVKGKITTKIKCKGHACAEMFYFESDEPNR